MYKGERAMGEGDHKTGNISDLMSIIYHEWFDGV